MKRNKVLERIGFRYVLNHNQKEIHRVADLKNNCSITSMSNAGYHTKFSQFLLRKFAGYDGCKKCNAKFHIK